ncbi:MAG: PQQ-binding-like beta-propeller repeat protein [Candidatus Altiarchaeota archaeon]|nr:PQQ-binding-like beta-propeller repeat protein [Candidatus Altiarchaeota archaeon]
MNRRFFSFYGVLASLLLLSFNATAALEDDLLLDFSGTQASFIDPMESWPVYKFRAVNNGTTTLRMHFSYYCESAGNVPAGSPQGTTPLAPGESMYFKILPGGDHCGYDSNTPQTIDRTLYMQFTDHGDSYTPSENSFTLNKTIRIKVVDRQTLAGNVSMEGTVMDEDGNPVQGAEVDVGGYGAKVALLSDTGGDFSYSLAESPTYLIVAHKDGYRTATVEINGSSVQDSYNITLIAEDATTVTASLINSVSGRIGFWRCDATADESRLLLVNGMENWEDESLKNESRLYLLNTSSGDIIWTHDMGWEGWSADITDDGRYAVFGTKLSEFDAGPEDFVNYFRLLNGTDGSLIWQKNITAENFPNSSTGLSTAGMKFSHKGEHILVHVEHDYIYMLDRSDGSIEWSKWTSQNIREIIFSGNDEYVYVPTGGGWLYKLKVADGTEVWKQWIGCWAYVNGFDISADESHIAVGSKAAYLTVINTTDGSIRFTKDIHGGTTTCSFTPDGSRIVSGGDLLTMFNLDGNVVWRYYDLAGDIRFPGDGSLIFTTNGGVYSSNGAFLYDMLPGFDRSTKVGWINSDATRYIYASQDTASAGENIIEVYRIETGGSGECELAGDEPPCGEVTLSEVVSHINSWSSGEANLADVIALINAWAG